MILPRAYSFIYSRVSVSFPFLWAPKIQGAAFLARARIGVLMNTPTSSEMQAAFLSRVRIGVEIIYSSLAFLVDMAETGHNCAVSVFC